MSANDSNRRRPPPKQVTNRNQRPVSDAGNLSMQNETTNRTDGTKTDSTVGGRNQRPVKRPMRTSGMSLDQQQGSANVTNFKELTRTTTIASSKVVSNSEPGGQAAAKFSTTQAASREPALTSKPPTSATQSGGASRPRQELHQSSNSRPQEAAYLNQATGSGVGGGSGGGRDSTSGHRLHASRSESTQHLTEDTDDSLCVVGNVNDDEVVGSMDGDLDSCGGSSGGGRSGPHLPLINAGLTKNLVWAVFASAVGSSFQHGYNGGVVNAPERLIGQFVNATYLKRHGETATEAQIDLIIAIIVSIFCIGGCIGALMTAFVADRLGRKEGLIYNNIIVLIASPMMACSKSMSSYELLILGRLLIGINAGLNAGLAPLYLNEIAPIQLRGALGTIYQLVITISILLSNIFGLPSLLGDETSWPFLFAVPIIPAAFMLVALPHCYESPKHLLLNQGRELQAQQALAWFRQTGDVQEEMDELRAERELIIVNNRTIVLSDMLSDQSLRRPLTIAIVIMLSQQLSGINAVLFYSTSIFRDAGLGEQAAVRATLGMSIVNVAMTLVSLFLVDRAGRRTLHMTGLMGMAATCLVLAVCLQSGTSAPNSMEHEHSALTSGLAVIAVYVFIAMFASGPGAIPWFLVAELFPSNARPLASSIAVAVNWLANFTVSLCFLPLSNLLHGFVFVLFAILLVIFYLFTYYKVPETRGATAEEISALFKR